MKRYSIGVIASLTGPAAVDGKSFLDGLELAKKNAEKSGIELELIVEDDETKPARTVAAFHKLTRVDGVRIIVGGTWDYLFKSIAPLAQELRVGLITPTNPVELFSQEERENQYLISTSLSIAAEEEAFAEFLQEKKIKSLGLAYSSIPWGEAHAEMVKRVAARLAIPVLLETRFALESYPTILTDIALKFSRMQPDLIYASVDERGIDLMTTKFANSRYAGALITTGHLGIALEKSKFPQKFNNSYALYPKIVNQDFIDLFRSTYLSSPSVYSGQGYDAGLLAVAVLQRGVSLTRSAGPLQIGGATGILRLPSFDGSAIAGKAVVMTVNKGALVAFDPNADRAATLKN